MIIDRNTPAVDELRKAWGRVVQDKRSAQSSLFQQSLAQGIIAQALKDVRGQLILVKSTRPRPRTVGHSFAHGAEVVCDLTEEIIVARLSASGKSRFRQVRRPWRKNSLLIISWCELYVPVSWKMELTIRYSGGRPRLTIDEKEWESSGPSHLSLEGLGEILFSSASNRRGWANDCQIVVGTKAARSWLIGRKAGRIYKRLSEK